MEPEQTRRFGSIGLALLEASLRKYVKEKRFEAAEQRFVRLATLGWLSDELFNVYVQRFIYRRIDRRLGDMARSNRLPPFQRLMARTFDYSRRGMRDEAGACVRELLRLRPDDPQVWRARWFVTRYSADLEAATHAGLRVLTLSEKPDFRFARRIALDAERVGNFAVMAFALKRACRDAEHAQKDRSLFRREYVWLSRFWLEVYDVKRATEVAAMARRQSLPLAADIEAELGRLQRQFGAFRPEIEDAKLDIKRRLGGVEVATDPAAVEVVISANFVSFKPKDSPDTRASLRFALSEILDTVKSMKRPIRIRSKFDGQATAQGGPDRCLISYHTEGPPGETLHLKEGYHPGFVTLDRKGYSGWASVADLAVEDLALDAIGEAEAEAHYAALRARFVAPNVSKYDQPPVGAQAVCGGHVFVALQIVNDAVQSLARVPMLAMLEEVTACATARGVPVVVKRHPRCNSPAVAERLRAGAASGAFVVSDRSIHELIEAAVAVCTVNSGVGLEALFHLKPVYLFGGADYRHVCRDVGTPGAFASVFRGDEPLWPALTIKRYLRWLYEHHFIDCSDAGRAGLLIRSRVHDYVIEKRGERPPSRWFGLL